MKRAFLFGLGTFLILEALTILPQLANGIGANAIVAVLAMILSVPAVQAAKRAPPNHSRLHAVFGWILGFLIVSLVLFTSLGMAAVLTGEWKPV